MTDTECRDKISQLDWHGLELLWDQIVKCDTPDWDKGKAFEYLIIRMFEIDALKVKYPFSVTLPYNSAIMEQIDGVVYLDSIGILIESKDYSNNENHTKKNISIEPIAKLRNQLLRRPYLSIGCVFSSGGFTESVSTLIDYLGNETILLWTGEEIDYCIKKRAIREYLLHKIENRIEFGIHDFNITTLDI